MRIVATAVQRLLMLVYRAAERSGVLTGPRCRALFETAYSLYKERIEASYLAALEPYALPATTVVDVGANIGVFTRRFATWTGAAGCVIAIEPEARNFERLQAMIRARGLDRCVIAVQAAAAEHSGNVTLAVDPLHPGGHVLAPHGLVVPAIIVDEIVERGSGPRVSLIKIDVQGAEMRVLQGSIRTLDRWHPALLVEMDEAALQAQGASVAAVVEFLTSRGYRGHFISSGGITAELDQRSLIAACLDREYVDVLFLPGSTSRTAGT